MRTFVLTAALLAVASIGHAQEKDDWDWGQDEWADEGTGLQWTGFVEGAAGTRWNEDPARARSQTLGDLRLRIDTEWTPEQATVGIKADLWYDHFLEELEGDLRDLTIAFSPVEDADVKLGRQVLTWGTGDLLFLNDLFPKDWVSFFAGRDDEYLKAPSNAVRMTWYTSAVNMDIVWTPVFEPDEFLTGERFSFFSARAGQRVAPEPPLTAIEPDSHLDNGELAIRFFKTVKGSEYAVYLYRGFFPQPTAFNDALEPTFAPLTALGGSLRRSLGAGVFNTEIAYYASRDDRSGTDPLTPNDQFRALLGYELEAITNLNVAFQYYLEWVQDHDELIGNSPTPQFEADEYRHVLTNRLTWRLFQDKLTLSLFTFYSPSDEDYYVRPVVNYRHSDRWTFSAGANVFGGDDDHTFFNQFADNSNVYARVRFHY